MECLQRRILSCSYSLLLLFVFPPAPTPAPPPAPAPTVPRQPQWPLYPPFARLDQRSKAVAEERLEQDNSAQFIYLGLCSYPQIETESQTSIEEVFHTRISIFEESPMMLHLALKTPSNNV